MFSDFVFGANTLYALDWNISSSEVGPFGDDNFTLDLSSDFQSGKTISSNEMIKKFEEIKALL